MTIFRAGLSLAASASFTASLYFSKAAYAAYQLNSKCDQVGMLFRNCVLNNPFFWETTFNEASPDMFTIAEICLEQHPIPSECSFRIPYAGHIYTVLAIASLAIAFLACKGLARRRSHEV